MLTNINKKTSYFNEIGRFKNLNQFFLQDVIRIDKIRLFTI
jgi:hypothetical protein